jgi:enoyl-CoA hydratase
MTAALQLDVADGIATLTIDQAGSKVNVLNRGLWEEFAARLAELAGRTDLRGAIVRSGKPGMFLAGADLNEIAAIPLDDQAAVRELVRRGADVLAALEALPCPTMALIDGPALGGGLEVALACDFRIVGTHPKVTLGLPEVKLGLIPGWGGTQRLPRIIGPTKALRLIATGVTVDALGAVNLGLVDEFVVGRQLDVQAELRLSGQIFGPVTRDRKLKFDPIDRDLDTFPAVFAEIRDLMPEGEAPSVVGEVIAAGCRLPLSEALAVETEAFVRLVGSAQAREKIAAFFNKQGRKS